jgi:hypothetical protein
MSKADRKLTFLKFSSIKRRFPTTDRSQIQLPRGGRRLAEVFLADILKTMTIKFLKPRKLGAASESWLRHDALGAEWTAAMCLYFFLRWERMGCRGCIDEKLLWEACERTGRLIGASVGLSLDVTVAVSLVSAIVQRRRGGEHEAPRRFGGSSNGSGCWFICFLGGQTP